jgi:small-conductance mechanosensitive channel
MPFWQRLLVVGAVIAVAVLAARVIDRRIARRQLDPEVVTRYRVLRRTVVTIIVGVGVLSALLVIPQVRAVAGGLLASSAVAGLVIGFAARSTLANFVAGVLIAITQPLRIDDHVEIAGVDGVVEEIGLTYTFIRTSENARLVIPNEKLASDTIRNSTIISREKLAEVTVPVGLDKDLPAVVGLLQEAVGGETDTDVLVTALEDSATVMLRARAPDEEAAERLASELRLRAHGALRAAGVYG